jgi:hypothetical protein
MLTQRIRRGEIILDLNATHALVMSQTERGKWHEVTPESCDCPGFKYRTTCRHIGIAFPAVLACEQCGALNDVVTDCRFIIGIGQVEVSRCRDLVGCDVRSAAGDTEDVSTPVTVNTVTTFTPPADPTLRGLYPVRT